MKHLYFLQHSDFVNVAQEHGISLNDSRQIQGIEDLEGWHQQDITVHFRGMPPEYISALRRMEIGNNVKYQFHHRL